jgi:eukaryotic-like serine/threonine-protein kinase
MAESSRADALAQARRLESAGRAEGAARAFAAAGAADEAARVMRSAGRLDLAVRILADAGFALEAALCQAEAGDPAAALDRIVRLPVTGPGYREAAREAVTLACRLDSLGIRFEQFIREWIAAGPDGDADLAALYSLAELYLKKGMPENAEESFGKILARSPGYRDVPARLAALGEKASLDGALARVIGDDERFRRSARPVTRTPAPASPTPRVGGAFPPTRRLESIDLGAPPPSPTFSTGAVVAERYLVEGEIGRGGMATVYRAKDLELSEEVALKVFRPVAHDEAGLARFRQELKLSRRLTHPNITRVYDMGVHQGMRYISMELLVGHSVEELNGTPWALRRGLDCLIQVCQGLAAAHGQGVIHRDIKPANLFLTREGLAKIMDFGIARQGPAHGVTQVGMVVGTPEYISPEQIRGEVARETSDLYALGVVAYEMFAGRKPFVHDDLVPLLQMHLAAPPDPPSRHKPGLPAELESAILTLLHKDPKQRFPSARALEEALVAVRGSGRG